MKRLALSITRILYGPRYKLIFRIPTALLRKNSSRRQIFCEPVDFWKTQWTTSASPLNVEAIQFGC